VATAEQAHAIARLQKQLAESQDRRKHAEDSNASLKTEIAELRTELTAQAENLELQVIGSVCRTLVGSVDSNENNPHKVPEASQLPCLSAVSEALYSDRYLTCQCIADSAPQLFLYIQP
jgi:hypothetical protein